MVPDNNGRGGTFLNLTLFIRFITAEPGRKGSNSFFRSQEDGFTTEIVQLIEVFERQWRRDVFDGREVDLRSGVLDLRADLGRQVWVLAVKPYQGSYSLINNQSKYYSYNILPGSSVHQVKEGKEKREKKSILPCFKT